MLTSGRRVQASRLNGTLAVLFVLLAGARFIRAQTSAPMTREGWVAGALVGRIHVDDVPNGHGTAIGVGATRFTPRQPGLDLAVMTIPRLLRDGQIPLHARVGMAFPLGTGNGPVLVPTVGVDAAGALGETEGSWVGYHAGARALFATRQLGVQVGLHWVRAVNAPNTLWLAELGLMRVPALAPPKPRPASSPGGQF